LGRTIQIALAGNPNSGKSTVFNLLTGMRQRTGNYPGTTVELRKGKSKWKNDITIEVTDLPGFYSVFPKGEDERVAVSEVFGQLDAPSFDWIIYVADASNLRRSLLLFTQLADLGLPLILVLNMSDLALKNGREIDILKLTQVLDIPVVWMNARTKAGYEALQDHILSVNGKSALQFNSYGIDPESARKKYQDMVRASNRLWFQKDKFPLTTEDINDTAFQAQDTVYKYTAIDELLRFCSKEAYSRIAEFSDKVDSILTHRIWGYIVFLGVFFLMFQSIFSLAQYPMDWIEGGFSQLAQMMRQTLPENGFSSLLIDGVLAGMSGVAIFLPQIAILFAFLTILEDSGYMARVSFIMDKVMHKFGLNGRSVVPLIGGMACAVVSIMAARTIENRKERLLTILVTPLMSCSARLPVYTLLIALITPPEMVFGIFNLQGILLFAMYILGVVASLGVAYILNYFIRIKENSFFIMELPLYRWPVWGNIWTAVWTKSKAFLWGAGRIIVVVSIVLYLMGSYNPPYYSATVSSKLVAISKSDHLTSSEKLTAISSIKLEYSYLGLLGSAIEPFIRPLGYDWKIGIGLISSLAAREVFVGTMTTIYSLQDKNDTESLRVRMANEKDPSSGKPVYNIAVVLSLLVFYAFALQCASTIVTVRKETNSWIIALTHFLLLSAMAYIGAFLTYRLAIGFI